MKISLKWLGDHIDVADFASAPERLAKVLTDAGLEVEGWVSAAETFRHVKVGLVKELIRHPDADRLTVCQIDVGEGSTRQIVCGAKNHRAGDKVVVTLPGAILPGNFAIKASKIRGAESLGMLASEAELGLAATAEGILILPADAPIGEDFAKYRGLDDVIFELKITPNRGDCLSHLGLARELSGLLSRPLKATSSAPTLTAQKSGNPSVRVEIGATSACPRYAGVVMTGVRVGESPTWLKTRLESIGLNSINNVVDVTNFVMMDLGQPLHAFDFAKIAEAKISVSHAEAGEAFTTLDGRELKLSGDELTIRDAHGALALAGVMGGRESGVSDSTQTIFIESANFASESVRRTSRFHRIQSDAAFRFARGVDPALVPIALERARTLMADVAGASATGAKVDEGQTTFNPTKIAITAEYVGQRLGYPVQSEGLRACLLRLGCEVAHEEDRLMVTVPTHRPDLERDVDLVEEYGRIEGYDKIPSALPILRHAPLAQDKSFVFDQRVGSLARGAGFSRAVNFAFVNDRDSAEWLGNVADYALFGLDMDAKPVALQNPLSDELNVMRTSLLPGLFKNVLHNVRHGGEAGRLFEVGSIFARAPEGFREDRRLSLVTWGMREGLWRFAGQNDAATSLFYDLKSRFTAMCENLGLGAVSFVSAENVPAFFHPARTASVVVEGRSVGLLGCLHPQVSEREKLRVPVAVAELNLKSLERGQPRPVKFKSIAKFPAVERDLAFVLPPGRGAQEVIAEIRRAAGPTLRSVEIFDVFRGGNLPEGHASIAYRMRFQDPQQTLTDESLSKLQASIVKRVEDKLGLKVRSAE